MTEHIAIIGAGLSGLTLAHHLNEHRNVTVFEKSRRAGGRIATRTPHPFSFDHGPQCFTARGPDFINFLKPYLNTSRVAQWTGNVVNLQIGKNPTPRPWRETHLVASPEMNSLCAELANKVNLNTQVNVAPLSEKKDGKWILHSTNGNTLGLFDWVISTAPPEQSLRLLKAHIKPNSPLHNAKMHKCIALMVGFQTLCNPPWIAAKIHNNPVKWISVNSSKPQRNKSVTCLVAHARNTWSEIHFNNNTNSIQNKLAKNITQLTGINCNNADHLNIHKWKYAIVKKYDKAGYLLNPILRIAAAGDWCVTSRLEEVWWNASSLAKNINTEIAKQK